MEDHYSVKLKIDEFINVRLGGAAGRNALIAPVGGASYNFVCPCSVNPTGSECLRWQTSIVRHSGRAPHRQRGHYRAAGSRDDGGGSGSDGGDPPGRLRPTRLDIFIARCEARALLWQCGEYDLHNAVDVLQADADASGLVLAIGDDGVQKILAHAFAAVRGDLNGWRPLSFRRQS